MPFDRQRRLVFLHIPKTAGSSVEQALNLFGPWQQENLQTGFGLIQSRDLLAQNLSSNFLQHLTLRELEKQFPDVVKDAVLFTVVRDPWRRLLSSFRNPDPDLVAYYRWRTANAPVARVLESQPRGAWVRACGLRCLAPIGLPGRRAVAAIVRASAAAPGGKHGSACRVECCLVGSPGCPVADEDVDGATIEPHRCIARG